MKYKNLLTEMQWNDNDIKAIKNAQPNLDKAEKLHKKLLKKLNPIKKKLQTELNMILKQETGRGNRGEEEHNLKNKIQSIDNQIEESEKEINRLTRVRDSIIQMQKK